MSGKSDVTLNDNQLHGNLGVGSLVFSVVAFAAPLVVVGSQLPSIIVYTRYGIGLAYILPVIIWLIFSVPFVTMNTHIGRPGAFYAFITAGLGKATGLGGAFTVTVAYFLFLGGMWVCVGRYLQEMIVVYGGPTIPWYVFGLIMLIVIGILGVLKIDLSAKVLGVFLILEVIIIVVFDVAVFAKNGFSGLIAATNPANMEGGNLMLAFLFATNSFFGFESAAVMREEAKDPIKTVKVATYTAVISVGAFYFCSALAMVTALGHDGVFGLTFDSGATLFSDLLEKFVAPWMPQVIAILMITSSFATTLAQHNTITRYLYSFGKDGVLWKKMGTVHPERHSPYIASMVLSGASLLVMAILCVSSKFDAVGDGPFNYYVRTGGLGAATLIFALCFVCIAITRFFIIHPEYEKSIWKTKVAPMLAFCGLLFILICAVTNLPDLIGWTWGPSLAMACVIPAIFLGGFFYAKWLEKNKPEVYAKIGRN